MAPDFNTAHELLPLLESTLGHAARFEHVTATFEPDGAIRFDAQCDGRPSVLRWREHARGAPNEVQFARGVVVANSSELADLRAAARVAKCLERLHAGTPPDLLQWRNRNMTVATWGTKLVTGMFKSMLTPGQSRYFDYRLMRISEYEGYLNFEFTSANVDVDVRAIPAQSAKNLDVQTLPNSGPIAIAVTRDTRTGGQRALREHRVEDFVGYVISRNVPNNIELSFERGEPPAGYTPSDAYVDFLRRGPLDDYDCFLMLCASSDDIAIVSSCDRECLNVFSFLSSPVEPWDLIAPWQIRPRRNLLGRFYNQPATQQSIVSGNDPLEGMLGDIASSPNPPRLITYVDSCVNRLIGYDFLSPIGRFKQAHGTGAPDVIPFEVSLSTNNYWCEYLRRLYVAMAAPTLDKKENAVSLLGIGPDPTGEFRSLLRSVGVGVAGNVYPNLTRHDLETFGSASLVVCNVWTFVGQTWSAFLKQVGLPVLTTELPYGVDGTVGWVNQIQRAMFGADAQVTPSELPGYDSAVEAVSDLKKVSRGQRLAIFARASDYASELDPSSRYGVALPRLFAGLGFDLDLCLFMPANGVAESRENVLERLGLDPAAQHRVIGFESHRQLPDIMKREEFRLVYTEMFRDERVTAYGKTPITMRVLFPGFSGIVQTAGVIASALGFDFYRQWQRYLPGPWRHLTVAGPGA